MISTVSILNQLSQLSSQAGETAATVAGVATQAASASSPTDFASVLKQSLADVNDTQVNASQLSNAFESGDSSVDLGQTVVAGQKASLAFSALTQVRNDLTDAYKQIMDMTM
ncbi:flagellar hook-basal body complex protein FliE [Frateuria aurantia]